MRKRNTSSAVMAQRKEPHDSLDDFPTMPWGTRALMEHVLKPAEVVEKYMTVWEPSANRGYMARPLGEYFETVYTSDVHDYGMGYHVHDFLESPGPNFFSGVDWIITNPPFRLAKQFILRGLEVAKIGVAVVVRTSFLESKSRYYDLYQYNPPTIVAPFVERIPMFKGRVDPTGGSATSYSWMVWIKKARKIGANMVWIPPCRKQLERDEDYAPSITSPSRGKKK